MNGNFLLVVLMGAYVASIAGAVMLSYALVCRSRKEARRELFGLSPRLDPWP
jgi:hypothetical protein